VVEVIVSGTPDELGAVVQVQTPCWVFVCLACFVARMIGRTM